MSCGDGPTEPKPIPPTVVRVAAVALDRSTLEMTVGDRDFLAAKLTPQNADNQTVIWSSSDTSVATVDLIVDENGEVSGEVNALSAGETTVSVRTLDGGFEASCTVTVAAANAPSDDPENPDPNGDNDDDPDNPTDPDDDGNDTDPADDPTDPDDGDPSDTDNPDDGDPDNSDPNDTDNPDDSDPDDPENPDDGDNPVDPDDDLDNPTNPDDDPVDPDDEPTDPDDGEPAEPSFGGAIGSLSWSLDAASGTLTITGSGDLPDRPTPTTTRNSAATSAQASAATSARNTTRSATATQAAVAAPWEAHRQKITTLVLSASIGRIGANNFAACTNLTTVEIAATTPPELGSGNFDEQYFDTLIVPKASLELYKSDAAWWDAFSTIVGRE